MNSMSFLSNENKGLLWELVKDTGIFDKLVNIVSRSKIMEIFEELLLKIDNNNLSIKEKNKQFLGEYIHTLNQLQTMEINIETKEELKKQRENLFEERLRLKQEEFRKFQPQIPPAINFLEKEQDVKFEPQKDFIDLTNITYDTKTIHRNEVKEVKKRVSFQDLLKPELKEVKLEELQEHKELQKENNHLKELKEEIKEIKELLYKISSKLGI
jgi:hypothetical protein